MALRMPTNTYKYVENPGTGVFPGSVEGMSTARLAGEVAHNEQTGPYYKHSTDHTNYSVLHKP